MKAQYDLQNLDCANCAAKMQQGITKLDGVTACSVNFLLQKMTIETDGEMTDTLMKAVKKVIKKLEPQVMITKA